MPNITANGIQIEYDTFGDKSSPPLLLIMGWGVQMIGWDEEFCKQLADKGLYVIRFDNRDVGLSTKFEEAGIPDIMELMAAVAQGQEVESPYSLNDMADDAVGLLAALGLEKAHVCGMSMGARITQVIGYRHPARVLSLIPIMGTTGNPDLPPAKPEAMEVLATPAPQEREAYIEHTVKTGPVLGGSGFPFDEKRARDFAARTYDRAFYPQGQTRQMAAIVAGGNRKPLLAGVTAPTLVIHGSEDPLVPLEGGLDTADGIPGAEMLIIEGMGHGLLPVGAWPQIIEAIAGHIAKADAG
jgi:pimeloyl-ACP methyl ester carboxylesterase